MATLFKVHQSPDVVLDSRKGCCLSKTWSLVLVVENCANGLARYFDSGSRVSRMSNVLSDRLLKSFFCSDNLDSFRQVQHRAFVAADFDPQAIALRRLESQLDMASPTDLLAGLEALPWFFQICPRRHFVEARIRENLGEIEDMQENVARMQHCLRMLMETGDGTREAPYCVTFVVDQRDILRVIGEEVRYQQMVEGGDRRFDVITAHSGEEVWFDATMLRSQISAAHFRPRQLYADPS